MKDTTEHMIECRDSSKELGVKTEWLKETGDIKIIRKVNKWLKKKKRRKKNKKRRKKKRSKKENVKVSHQRLHFCRRGAYWKQ